MINSFNNSFKEICRNLRSSKQAFVLGLSGGIDSIALLHLLKNFLENCKEFEIEIYPIIIDHNLRKESGREAKKVKKIAQNLGFKTNIKKVHSNIPVGNIQNWARKNRRDLLYKTAYDLSANLILAHQFDDQAETVFMRLIKKSGLEGVQGIQQISFWNGISIIRPLLNFKKEQLSNYLLENNFMFFEDNSNSMLKFERVKTRCLLKKINKKNWPDISQDLNKISKININLIKKIKSIFTPWVQKNVFIDGMGAARVDYQNMKMIFEKSNLFTTNVFGKIIQTIGGKEYPPKRRKTYDLINSIFINNFDNKTLGNVNIFRKNNYLFFVREQRNLSFNMTIKKNKLYVFDGRFLIISKKSGKLINSCNSEFNKINNQNPFFEFRNIINKTIPCLQTLEGETIRPYLNIIDENSELSENKKQKSFNLYLINRVLV